MNLFSKVCGSKSLSSCLENRFFKDVVTLMSGTALAQVLGFLLMPVITRLFSPIEYGYYSSVMALVPIFSVLSTLQLDQALMLPESDEDAFCLFSASVACVVIFSVFSLFVFYFFLIKNTYGEVPPLFRGILSILFSFLVLFNSLSQVCLLWSTRQCRFKLSSISAVFRSLGSFSIQLCAGLAHLSSPGLLLGNILGGIASVGIFVFGGIKKDISILYKKISYKLVCKNILSYKEFPLYSVPQNFLNALSQGMAVLFLGYYYGPLVAGYYALGAKALSVPAELIRSSLRSVLFQRLSVLHNKGGDLFQPLKKVTFFMFLIAVIPSIAGFIYAPFIFSFFFGEQWLEAGIYARWLIIWIAVAFFNAPSVTSARVIRKQKFLLVFEILNIVLRALALLLGCLYLEPLKTVILFSVVGSFLNILLVGCVFFMVRQNKDQ